MTNSHKHDLAILDRILENGLCYGGGNGTTTFCAQQALAAVCGLPITDHPECAADAPSAFSRRLNDSRGWGDDKTRAAGMRDLLISQIGSKGVVDDREFARRIALKTIQRVLPIWLRHGKIDEKLVLACEQAKTLEEAREAALAARRAADYAAGAADYAAYAAARDKVLATFAEGVVQILIDMKAPGCKWLYLA